MNTYTETIKKILVKRMSFNSARNTNNVEFINRVIAGEDVPAADVSATLDSIENSKWHWNDEGAGEKLTIRKTDLAMYWLAVAALSDSDDYAEDALIDFTSHMLEAVAAGLLVDGVI